SPATMSVEIVNWALGLGFKLKPKDYDDVLAQLQSSGPFSVPFDPTKITDVIEDGLEVQNVVLAAHYSSGALQAIGVRVEIGGAKHTTHSDWQSFVDYFSPTLSSAGPDWNILVDGQLLADEASAKLKDGLAGMSDITLDSGPTGAWVAPGQFGAGAI